MKRWLKEFSTLRRRTCGPTRRRHPLLATPVGKASANMVMLILYGNMDPRFRSNRLKIWAKRQLFKVLVFFHVRWIWQCVYVCESVSVSHPGESLPVRDPFSTHATTHTRHFQVSLPPHQDFSSECMFTLTCSVTHSDMLPQYPVPSPTTTPPFFFFFYSEHQRTSFWA